MLLVVTQNDPEKELEYLDALDDKQVDGVILVATVFTAEHPFPAPHPEIPGDVPSLRLYPAI